MRAHSPQPDAMTRGPYYGDLEAPGEFRRMVRTVSVGGEIVLLHGDFHRLRMLVNLIANLNEHGIDHILLLGFNQETCTQLARRRLIGCAHSSYLWDETAAGEAGRLARRRARWTLAPKYVAWIQKFHYMRRLLEARLNVLALDVTAGGSNHSNLRIAPVPTGSHWFLRIASVPTGSHGRTSCGSHLSTAHARLWAAVDSPMSSPPRRPTRTCTDPSARSIW